MFTTAPRALSTAARNSSRYFASVEPKCLFQGSILRMLNFSQRTVAKNSTSAKSSPGTGILVPPRRSTWRNFASVEPKCLFQGSILRMLNFSPQCAAKSFRSIFWAATSSCAPNMKSRKGYDAMAMRSRASVGNCTWGPASTENASRGYNDAATAANADCTRNPLRVLCDKVGTVYQIHPNPEQSRPCSRPLSPARVRRIVNWSIRRMAACCDPESPSEVNQPPHCAVPVGQKSKIQQKAKKGRNKQWTHKDETRQATRAKLK